MDPPEQPKGEAPPAAAGEGESNNKHGDLSWQKEDWRNTQRALGSKKSQAKASGKLAEAEGIVTEAKKAITAEKFDDALRLFPQALSVYEGVEEDEAQREGMFHLYFSWAFALQEKGKREYLHMEGQDEAKVNAVDNWFIEGIKKLKLALEKSPNNPLALHSAACALICRGDLRDGIPADKRYAKACVKLKRAIDSNDESETPAALWRTWGNAALKRAQLRKVKLDEREELVNEAAEKYEKALKADPEDGVTSHTYALFMHFKANDLLAQAVRQKDVEPKLQLLLKVREALLTALEYKNDCTPAIALWSSYLEVHVEYIAPERQLQMHRESRETRKIVDWLNLRHLLQQRTDNILYFGYAVKQGGNRPNWKRRFFVLTPKKLFYYTEAGGKMKGKILLNQVASVTIANAPLAPRVALGLKGKGGPENEREDPAVSAETRKGEGQATDIDGWDEDGYGFHLVTPGRTFNVVVDYAKQRDQWTDAIYQAISVIPSRPSGSAIEGGAAGVAKGKGRLGMLSSIRKRASRGKDLNEEL